MKIAYLIIMILIFSNCSRLIGGSDTSTDVDSPDISEELNNRVDTFFTGTTGAFQVEGTVGVMDPAKETLEQVEAAAQRGCNGMDCIPQYTYPSLLSADDSNVGDNELILGVEIGGVSRAYPLSTFWNHEIANDTVGGKDLTVNYCPLTGTGLNFTGKTSEGEPLTFGVSGLLNNNNLILYDHQTTSFWPQMLFTAAWGAMKGTQITLLPVYEMKWSSWKKLFPKTSVVNMNASGIYPYGNYRENNEYILFSQSIYPSCEF